MDEKLIVEILATIITLVGCLIISIPKRVGLWILVVGQILWSIFAYLNNQNFFLFQSLFLLFFNFVGLYNWKRKGVGN